MTKNVYQLIAQVASEMARDGIAKDRNNAQQGYKFRGIDDVYNALAPVISKAGLVIIPRMISREFVERVSASNKAIFYVGTIVFRSERDAYKELTKRKGGSIK